MSWAGNDPNGSGVQDYSIYVSQDGGPFRPWLLFTTDTSGTFTGEAASTYAFFSLAHDAAGNSEPLKTSADTSTAMKDLSSDTDGDTIPNGTDPDDDNDGCLDTAEVDISPGSEQTGGQRDGHYFWDFYDVWTHPAGDPNGWERNRAINIIDILGVALRFGAGPGPVSKAQALADALAPPVAATGYHAAYDRGPIIGENNWDRAPADGTINVVHDVLGVASQYGHNCT